MKPAYIFVSLVCTLLVTSLGCGDGKRLIPVTGKVIVDGKPAEGATVLFFPASTQDPVSAGTCDSTGKYVLKTDMKDGAYAGSYAVSIKWPDPAVKPTKSQEMMGTFDGGPDLLKGKYDSKIKTTLKAEINEKTTEIATFELSSK